MTVHERLMNEITIVEADFGDPGHAEAVVEILDVYAQEPVEGGRPLPADVKARLPQGLAEHPTAFALLAFDAEAAVGVAVCIGGFSTFAGRPLINVHDLAVMPTHRGRGIGSRLLDAVTERARQTGCCKVTLEVRASNRHARRLYERLGFRDAGGQATQFLERSL
jgi:ribosomal protein S18 acetylase RimI-like enzyme